MTPDVAVLGVRGTLERFAPHGGMGPTVAAVTDRIVADLAPYRRWTDPELVLARRSEGTLPAWIIVAVEDASLPAPA
jgi:hypothetical protein